jgi:hypothetical protein
LHKYGAVCGVDADDAAAAAAAAAAACGVAGRLEAGTRLTPFPLLLASATCNLQPATQRLESFGLRAHELHGGEERETFWLKQQKASRHR